MALVIEPESGFDLVESVAGPGAFVLQAAKRAHAATVRIFFMLVYFWLAKK